MLNRLEVPNTAEGKTSKGRSVRINAGRNGGDRTKSGLWYLLTTHKSPIVAGMRLLVIAFGCIWASKTGENSGRQPNHPHSYKPSSLHTDGPQQWVSDFASKKGAKYG